MAKWMKPKDQGVAKEGRPKKVRSLCHFSVIFSDADVGASCRAATRGAQCFRAN